jgi:hypothetical protein
MIVVAMTSWVKRIENVKPVVENIMKGTLQPDRLYLSLSVEEFPNKETDLPKDLVDYFNSDGRLILNWVEGENTKTMKKVFPVLQYLDDDDIILPVDDDIMYPLDYVEKRVMEYKTHFQPISGLKDNKDSYLYTNNKMLCNLGYCCLFTKKMMKHWDEYVDDKVLRSYNDDTCYAMIEWLNGYIPQVCKYNYNIELWKKCRYNEIEPSGKLNRYTRNEELINLHNDRIREVTGTDYKNSFNFYNRNNLHHIFIPYIAEFSDDPQNDNRELKYCITGINKFFTEKHIIHIISDKPIELDYENVDIMVLPRLDIAKNTSVGRFADSANRLKYAFENIDCEEAIIYWDDTYALNPFTYEDCRHSKYVKKSILDYKRDTLWGDGVWNAVDCINHFGKKCEKNYCSHVPFVFNKSNYLQMLSEFNYLEHPFNMDLAYFNIYQQDDEVFVPWRCSKENPEKSIYKKEVKTKKDLENAILNSKWSTIDIPLINFNHFDVLDCVYFGKKMTDNIDVNINSKDILYKTSNLQKIREGIRNGSIVKEYKPDGTYIWKKVRK